MAAAEDAATAAWPPWDAARAAEALGPARRSVLKVLDPVDPASLLLENSGRWEMARRDLDTVFGPERGLALEKIVLPRVAGAFALRDNLINLKKVYLHFLKTAQEVERRLLQFTTLFFWDGKAWCQHLIENRMRFADHEAPIGAAIYVESSRAFQRVKGLVFGMRAARQFTKCVCCVPRDPNKAACLATRTVPYSFDLYYALRELRDKYADLLGPEWTAVDLDAPPEDPDVAQGGLAPGCRAALDNFEALLAEVDRATAMDAGSLHFVRQLLVARGVSKALRIEVEARRLHRALLQACDTIAHMSGIVRAKYEEDDFEFFCLVRPMLVLESALLALQELATWLAKILAEPTTQYFNAGDWSTASTGLVLPEGFGTAKDLLQRELAFADKHTERLAERLRLREGEYKTLIQGRIACKRCAQRFGKAFVGPSGLCFFCDKEAREKARSALEALREQAGKSESGQTAFVDLVKCPIALRCSKQQRAPTMCPHSLKCFVCDAWACEACGVMRCDGEGALGLIQDVQPDVLFLDFDRTLASTRTGSSPLHAKGNMVHTVDPHLKQAALAAPRAHVVTRNSHVADIADFLALHGLGHLEVHSIKRMAARNKAEVIRDLMGPGERAVFCDDSPQEILDPALRELVLRETGDRLRTVLFVRGP